ncbi:MAG: transposase [Pontiellaceae bacterium]|nr:transposase [Pontiellaceae bacterium]
MEEASLEQEVRLFTRGMGTAPRRADPAPDQGGRLAAGFRTKSFSIITTLLDPVVYPAEKLAELYSLRRDVELFFRHIKMTKGLDVLRCKTPEMVRKEMLMHFISPTTASAA